MEKRHRIFIAINLPGDIKKSLAGFQEKLKEYSAEWAKWTDKENLHITLQFLGNITDEELGGVCVAVKEVVEGHESFSLDLNKILYGPPNKVPPKMIWAEGKKSQELSNLRQDLESALMDQVRFVPENRVFAPHVTLARINAWAWKQIEPEERPEINEDLDLLLTVESIDVMESEMKKDGPVYTVLETHQLR